MEDFNKFEFRSSTIGKILSKSGKFTDGNKTYIEEVFAGHIHKTKKHITSKYFEKGLFEEESGITLLQNTLHKNKLIVKNKERKSNGYIHGEADCIVDGIVYDIKNAWDCFTFEKAELTHDYEWQLVSYAWLWGLEEARLFYALNDTPEYLILDEERRLMYSGNYGTTENEQYIIDCKKLRERHVHRNKPLEERFKLFEVVVTSEKIDQIKKAVIKAREYMIELNQERNIRILINKSLMK